MKCGESSRLSLTTAGSSMNAALGGESAGGIGTPELDVTQSGGGPCAFVATQSGGSAGGVTPSKFSIVVSQRTRRALHGNWRNGSKNIDSAPASNVVWWARRPAQLVGDKMSRVIQRCSTSGNVVTQIWSRTPQQCHGASDMRGRHRRAAKTSYKHCRRCYSWNECLCPARRYPV